MKDRFGLGNSDQAISSYPLLIIMLERNVVTRLNLSYSLPRQGSPLLAATAAQRSLSRPSHVT